MNKYFGSILFVLIISILSSFSFSADVQVDTGFDLTGAMQKASLLSVVSEDGFLNLYGTGIKGYTSLKGFIDSKELTILDRSETYVKLANPDNLNGYVRLNIIRKNYSAPNSDLNLPTSSIQVNGKFENKILSLNKSSYGAYYEFNLLFSSKVKKGEIQVYIDGISVKDQDITFLGDYEVKVRYDVLSNINVLPKQYVSLSVIQGNKKFNTQYVNLDSDLTMKLTSLDKTSNIITAKFDLSYPDIRNVLVNGTEIFTDKSVSTYKGISYTLNSSSIQFEFDYDDDYKSYMKQRNFIKIKNSKGVTDEYILDFSKYFTPVLEKVSFTQGNFTGSSMQLFGDNLSATPDSIKILINSKEYSVSPVYKPFPELSGVIYNFVQTQGYRYDLPQPFTFTGDSVIQLKVNDKLTEKVIVTSPPSKFKSNFLSNVAQSSKSSLLFDFVPYIKTGSVSKTTLSDDQYQLGIFTISGGNSFSYYVNSIKFKLTTKSDFQSLPFFKVMLGNEIGYIKRLDARNFEIVFSNLYYDNLQYKSDNLNLYLADNLSVIGFEIAPLTVDYYQIGSNNIVGGSNIQNIVSASRFNVSYTYTPSLCFDIDLLYTNCRAKGYNAASLLEYSMFSGNSIIPSSSTSMLSGGSVPLTKTDSDALQLKEIEYNSRVHKSVISFMEKYDALVKKRYGTDYSKAKLFHQKILKALLPMIKKVSGFKKSVYEGIFSEIKSKI